eukprot:scaffold92611_cov29-Prasinocladus_malaysianus.AAC.1
MRTSVGGWLALLAFWALHGNTCAQKQLNWHGIGMQRIMYDHMKSHRGDEYTSTSGCNQFFLACWLAFENPM